MRGGVVRKRGGGWRNATSRLRAGGDGGGPSGYPRASGRPGAPARVRRGRLPGRRWRRGRAMGTFEIAAALVTTTALLAYVNRRVLRLPTSIGLMALSLALSLLVLLAGLA